MSNYFDLLLGRVAVCTTIAAYSRQTFPLTICWSVGLSDCLSVCPVHCGKTADRIRMPFGIVGRTAPWMRQVVEFRDRSTGRGNFEGKYGTPYCNQRRLFTIENSHCTAARLLLAEVVQLQSRRAVEARGMASRPSNAAFLPHDCGQACCRCSDRLSAMETRVDSLAALVQSAIMRPTDSVDSLASDSSQATAVHSTHSTQPTMNHWRHQLWGNGARAPHRRTRN